MKISFVIPARNEENYIARTIKSILRQPQELVDEIIVVSAASTDRTAEVASKFPKVKVITDPVSGTNRARQLGVAASQSELVAFIDADIIVPPQWSSRAIKIFEKNEKIVGVAGPYWYKGVSLFMELGVILHFLLMYILYIILHYIFRIAGVANGGNLIVKKEALDKIGGLNVNIKFWGDDADTVKRLRKVGFVIFSPFVYVYSSTRRFKREGLVRTIARYTLNYFYMVLFNRPFNGG